MSESGAPIVIGRNLTKSYDRGRIQILSGVSLTVRSKEVVALWGASGSGKSTLLNLIAGLDVPTSGELSVAGRNPKNERDRLELRRRHVGMVFQLHNLIPDLTVGENLSVPALASNIPRAATALRVREVAEQLGLADRLAHRIQDLSGGERQRAAIGRALINRPEVILADEPTGSLDERTGDAVFALLRRLADESSTAILVATHERRFAQACDRSLHLRDGLIHSS